ncbi:hypothetical protein C8R47DRAFT_810557 [Mycena vitilis]|nr:hypothetical protein C8R47DRAFT_810557 [Mycena vitilis]
MLSMDTRRPPSPDDKYSYTHHAPTPHPSANTSAHTTASRRASPIGADFSFSAASNGNGTNGATTNGNGAAPARIPCINCGTLETPLWRRTPDGSPICNACGLYQKSRNMPRPPSLSPSTQGHATQGQGATHPGAHSYQGTAPNADRPHTHPPHPQPQGTCPGDGRCDGTGGTSACSGCPTWNNSGARLSSNTAHPSASNTAHPSNTSHPANNSHGASNSAHLGGGHGLSGPGQQNGQNFANGGQGGPGGVNALNGGPGGVNGQGGGNGQQGNGQQGGGGGGGGDEPASMRQILNPTPPPLGAGAGAGVGSPAGSFGHGSPPPAPANSTPAPAPQDSSAPANANANGAVGNASNGNGGSIPSTQGAGKINALACGNCGTSTTPLWRRDDVGNNICNACGASRFFFHILTPVAVFFLRIFFFSSPLFMLPYYFSRFLALPVVFPGGFFCIWRRVFWRESGESASSSAVPAHCTTFGGARPFCAGSFGGAG